MTVDGEFALNELWGDVFSVRGLEEVLDAFGDIEFPVFKVSGITGLEPSVGSECCQCFGSLVVVARCDSRAFDKDFTFLADFHLHSRQRTSDRAE